METSQMSFYVGDKVFVVNRQCHGILKFVGEIPSKEGIWAGIELLQQGAGKNDGSFDGHCYFTCPPNTGIFCPLSNINKPQTPPKTGVKRVASMGRESARSTPSPTVNRSHQRSPSNASHVSSSPPTTPPARRQRPSGVVGSSSALPSRREVQALESQLAAKEAAMATMAREHQEKMASLEASIHNLTQQLEAAQQQPTAQAEPSEIGSQQVADMEAELVMLKEELAAARATLEQQAIVLESSDQVLAREKLEAELVATKEAMQLLEQAHQEEVHMFSQTIRDLKEKFHQAGQSQKQSSSERGMREEDETLITTFKDMNRALQEELMEKEDAMKEMTVQHENEMAELHQAMARLQEQMTILEESAHRAESSSDHSSKEEIATLRTLVAEKESHLAQSQETITDLTSRIAELEQSFETLQAESNDQKAAADTLAEQLAEQKKMTESLTEEFELESKTLVENIEELTTKLAAAEEARAALEESHATVVRGMQDELDHSLTRLQEMENAMDEITEQARERYIHEAEAVAEEQEGQQQLIATLREQLDQALSQVGVLRQETEQAKSAFEEQTQIIQNAASEQQALQEQVAALSQEKLLLEEQMEAKSQERLVQGDVPETKDMEVMVDEEELARHLEHILSLAAQAVHDEVASQNEPSLPVDQDQLFLLEELETETLHLTLPNFFPRLIDEGMIADDEMEDIVLPVEADMEDFTEEKEEMELITEKESMNLEAADPLSDIDAGVEGDIEVTDAEKEEEQY